MQDKNLYEYAIIRFIPRVDREEFINVGIILYCQHTKFLQAAYFIDRDRLSNFSKDIQIIELEKHLQAIENICKGDIDSGSIGKLSIKERFRWLTSPRSTAIQISPIHTGFCADPHEILINLLGKLVK
jgi:hypothetical protein